jgi:hypothetical protein
VYSRYGLLDWVICGFSLGVAFGLFPAPVGVPWGLYCLLSGFCILSYVAGCEIGALWLRHREGRADGKPKR